MAAPRARCSSSRDTSVVPVSAGDCQVDRVRTAEAMGGGKLGRLSRECGRQRHERHMGQCGRRVRILHGAGAIVGGPGRRPRDLRNEQRRHNHRVATVLNRGEDFQASCMSLFFVGVERVDEDARVDCVAEVRGDRFANRTAADSVSRRPCLSPHGREEADAADAPTVPRFEAAARAHERVPGGCGISVFGDLGQALRRIEGQNHADGTASMCQDVRSPRIPHLTQDTRGMRFQFANADHLPRGFRAGRWIQVVPHVTTLRQISCERQRRAHWKPLEAPEERRANRGT